MEIKTVKDYYDKLYEMFPDVPKKDIQRILNYGWKSLYLHNSYGADTFIQDKDLWCYIGYLKNDSLAYFKYYIKKLIIKLRILYKRKKVKWDGYYYFALNDSDYQEYLSKKNKIGRPRKNFTFKNVMLYMMLDECKLAEYNKKYIFRIPYIAQVNFKFFIKKLVTDKAELIIERDALKFKDVLVLYNNFDVL